MAGQASKLLGSSPEYLLPCGVGFLRVIFLPEVATKAYSDPDMKCDEGEVGSYGDVDHLLTL